MQEIRDISTCLTTCGVKRVVVAAAPSNNKKCYSPILMIDIMLCNRQILAIHDRYKYSG